MDVPTTIPEGNVEPPLSPSSTGRVSVTITPRTLWLAMAIALTVFALWFLVSRALDSLILFFLAVILGEAIRPLVVRMERRHIPRPVAVLLIFLAVIAFVSIVLWLLINPLVAQLGAFSAHVPTYLTRLQQWVSTVSQTLRTNALGAQAIDGLTTNLASSFQRIFPTLLGVPLAVLTGGLGAMFSIVVVLTVTVFWLMSSQRLGEFVLSLFPVAGRLHVGNVIGEVGRSLGGYVRGVLAAMVLIGVLTGIGLAILGMPYALPLALLAGLTEFIPYLGPWISGSAAVLVALLAVDPLKALEVVILFVVVQQVEGNLVQPLIMSKAVNLDPLLVLVAITVGVQLLGIIGAILAVPIVAAMQVVVMRVIAPAIRRSSSHWAPASSLPEGTE